MGYIGVVVNKKLFYLLFSVFFLTICVLRAETGKAQNETIVYVIPIEGDIEPSLTIYVRRAINEAEKNNADYIIFEINTFGGRVDSALQITTLIGSMDNITTIAYVTFSPEGLGVSWSAGALIAFSCNKIFMAPGTSIGAAAPVFQGKDGKMEMAPEKVVSAVRTQIAALAEKNSYSKSIAAAMVDDEIELKEVYIDDKLEVLTPDEIKEIESSEPPPHKIKIGKTLCPVGKLLSLTAGDMEKYNVSSGTVPERSGIIKRLGLSNYKIVKAEESPSDEIIRLITSSAIVGILISIGLIAAYVEISHPGFGIPGTIAIISFGTVFISHFLLGTVDTLELVLLIAGFALLALEIFVIPGFGVAGVGGIACIMISLVLAMQSFVLPSPDQPWQWVKFKIDLATVGLSFTGAIIGSSVIMMFLPKTRMFSHFSLNLAETPEEGYRVNADISTKYNGKTGIAVTTLRPAGKIEIDGEILSVETEGTFLEKGTNVRVIETNSNRILVREC